MLPDSDLEKLCHGRLVYVEVQNSQTNNPAGPHWAVIIDSDEQIPMSEQFNVVVITHNTQIDPDFLVRVPPGLGIDSSSVIACGYGQKIHEAGIKKIGPRLFGPKMIEVMTQVNLAKSIKERQRSKKSKRSQDPT
jgi:mRNA-degrading endonuclease toxin of MazEF toxin-antitoxin module